MTPDDVKTEPFKPCFSGKPVIRSGLYQKLDAAVKRGRQLICVTAPAGYGKTVLISSWLPSYDGISLWVSGDSAHSDFPRFLFHLITVVQTRIPGFCSEVLPLLSNLKPDELSSVQTIFLNDLSVISTPILLCFEDFHLIEDPEIHRFLALLVDRLPETMSIVLISRTRPPLPIARFRVRGQLLELTAADLRFSPEETKTFLQANHGLHLSESDLNALIEKTEGWAAAIHLAALVIASSNASHVICPFIQSISGSQEYIADFLMDEVLLRQDKSIQAFLLNTSVVGRFNISLAAVLSGISTDKANSIIDGLIRSNMFLIPLDSNNTWFRYHHLFSSFLRARLASRQPAAVDQMLSAAGSWFLSKGYLEEAIDCALQKESTVQAVQMILENWPGMLHEGKIDLMINWCKRLPASIYKTNPGMNIAYAWALMLQGYYSGVPQKLDTFDHAIGDIIRSNPDYLHSFEGKRLQIEKMLLMALVEYSKQQWGPGLGHSIKAREMAHPDFPLLEGNAWIISGHIYKQMGQLADSVKAFQTGIPMTWREGNTQASIGAHNALANLLTDRGDLDKAVKTCLDGIRLAAENRMAETPAAAPLFITLASIYIEMDRLDEAEEMLNKGLAAGRINHSMAFLFSSAITQIRLLTARGKLDEALEIVDGVSHYLSQGSNSQVFADLQAIRVLLPSTYGSREFQKEPPIPDLSPRLEQFQAAHASILIHIRALAATGKFPDAISYLDQCIQLCEESDITGVMIRFLIVRAKIRDAAGDPSGSRMDLLHAHELGDPLGFVRSFIDEPVYTISRLTLKNPSRRPDPHSEMELIVPLTSREEEILVLIKQGLSNSEVAARLSISLSTVKKHTSSIFRKMGVTSRSQAIVHSA